MTQSEVRSINGREISDNYSRNQLLNKIDKNKINDEGIGKDELWSASKVNAQFNTVVNEKANYYDVAKKYNDSIYRSYKRNIDELKNDFLFDTTGNVLIENGEMKMIQDSISVDHSNGAVYLGSENCKCFEVTFAEGTNMSKVRLGFGDNSENFIFINCSNGNVYSVNGGVFNSNVTIGNILLGTLLATDKIKLEISGQNLKFFVNGILKGSIQNIHNATYLKNPKPCVSWRDSASLNNFTVTGLKTISNYPKFMHLSMDDTIGILKSLNDCNYASIFNEPSFSFLKKMHDKYGAVFTLNCWNDNRSGFTLANMTDKFKDEFFKNSDWLKFAFHSQDSTSQYETLDTVTAKAQYEYFVTNIIRFANRKNIDTIPRLHNYMGNINTVREWNKLQHGITGLLTADDVRVTNYYLNEIQRNSLENCGEFYDNIEGLWLLKTDLRLDTLTNPYEILDSRKIDSNYQGQQNSIVVFWHENGITTNYMKVRIEECCKWALDNGYIFEYSMNLNPKF